jgi:hypothetical protein
MDGRRPPSHSRLADANTTPQRHACSPCGVWEECTTSRTLRLYSLKKLHEVAGPSGPATSCGRGPSWDTPLHQEASRVPRKPKPKSQHVARMLRGTTSDTHVQPWTGGALDDFPGSDRAAAWPTPSSISGKFGRVRCSVWLTRESGFVAPPHSCTPPSC